MSVLRSMAFRGWVCCALVSAAPNASLGDAASPLQSRISVPDALLVDQSGKSVRLLGDVIADRVAVVNFIYASCTTTCPLQSAVMARLQRELGAELGSRVVLLSITVAPDQDTPERLARTAAKFESRDGWSWLTGQPSEVERVLAAFGASVSDPERHQPMVLVGRSHPTRWLRRVGYPSVPDLRAMIAQVAAP